MNRGKNSGYADAGSRAEISDKINLANFGPFLPKLGGTGGL